MAAFFTEKKTINGAGRKSMINILPLCTFAKREFEKNSVYRDILKKQ